MLNFVLAESALELVPKGIRNRPAVVSDAKRRGAGANKILLDRSFHHSAMVGLKDGEKRGRPDLVHAALVSVGGTPLYLDGGVKVWVHTCAGVVVDVSEKTRLPKNYFRFRGLMEKTLSEMPRKGLLKAEPMGIGDLVKRRIGPDLTIGLSVRGGAMEMGELASEVASAKNPCLVVGGFPHGHFSEETSALLDRLVRVDPRPLEAHVVTARVVYEVERAAKRIND